MGMKEVKLDIFELGYLLDACLRGSHLRSGTIRRFVDEWYDILNPTERMQLFEWTIRLTYDERWNSKEENYKPHFEPDSRCCGEDIMFVHRYHPYNQYKVTIEVDGKEETFDKFLLNGRYYINTSQFFATEDAKEIRHNPNPDWQDFMHLGVDYDRNIIEKYSDLIQ